MSSVAERMLINPRAQREARRRERWHRAALYATSLTLMLLILFPFLWMLQMSFRPNDDIFGYELTATTEQVFEEFRSAIRPGVLSALGGTR